MDKKLEKKKSRKWIIFILILALIIIAFFLYVYWPVSEREFSLESRNTIVYGALAEVGISDALVDITDNRTIVAYVLPTEMDSESANLYIMGAVASSANSEKLIIRRFENEKIVEELSINLNDIKLALNKTISIEELMTKIKS